MPCDNQILAKKGWDHYIFKIGIDSGTLAMEGTPKLKLLKADADPMFAKSWHMVSISLSFSYIMISPIVGGKVPLEGHFINKWHFYVQFGTSIKANVEAMTSCRQTDNHTQKTQGKS